MLICIKEKNLIQDWLNLWKINVFFLEILLKDKLNKEMLKDNKFNNL